MGTSQHQLFGPQKCFNGQNHWQLGWFEDRRLTMKAYHTPQIVTLTTFVDYQDLKTERAYVLINVDDRYFLQFNRAKYHNAGTGGHRNQVTIAEDMPGGTNLIAGLDLARHRFEIEHFQGTRSTLVIDVCDMIFGDASGDRVVLSIALNISACVAYSLPQRNSVERRRTELPSTSAPTTKSPTARPSKSPTANPSKSPTAHPPNQPTGTSFYEASQSTLLEFEPLKNQQFWARTKGPKLYQAHSKGWYRITSSNPQSKGWYSH
jgi:hypothetical protein